MRRAFFVLLLLIACRKHRERPAPAPPEPPRPVLKDVACDELLPGEPVDKRYPGQDERVWDCRLVLRKDGRFLAEVIVRRFKNDGEAHMFAGVYSGTLKSTLHGVAHEENRPGFDLWTATDFDRADRPHHALAIVDRGLAIIIELYDESAWWPERAAAATRLAGEVLTQIRGQPGPDAG